MDPNATLTEGEIRLRAYYIWQWLGCPEGYEEELWLLAERELRDERAKAHAAAASPETSLRCSDPGTDGSGRALAQPLIAPER